MKLGKITNSKFKEIMEKLYEQQLPPKTASALKNIIVSCNAEIKKYDDIRIEAVKRLGNKKEDGSLDANEDGIVNLSGDNAKEYTSLFNSLMEIDVPISPIKLDDLGDKVLLSAQDLMFLDEVVVA